MNGKFFGIVFSTYRLLHLRRSGVSNLFRIIARSLSHHALNLPTYIGKNKNLVNKVILKRAFANSANVPTSALLFQILMLCVRLFIN